MNERREPPTIIRWTIWLFISFAMFGNYYIYDSISPLADLLSKQLGFKDSQIGLLNAIYSIPNIFMVLIGGIIIDRIGTRRAVFIFTFLVMVGSLITALTGNFLIMAGGRFVFGIGAESMIVAITTIIARWFKGKELSFAFGLNLTLARLGSFMALNSPMWAKQYYDYWQNPLWISVIAGVFALVFISFYFLADLISSKKFELPPEGNQDKVVIKEIFSFGKPFWFISALCVTFYSAMFPFQTFAIKFFQEVHGTTREVGGNLSSILTLSAIIFTPIFGLIADRMKKKALLMMFGSALIIPVYLIMAYKIDLATPLSISGYLNIDLDYLNIHTSIPAYLVIPMSMMGIAFSMIPAVMWPYVALVVNQSKLGTAYGLMTMIQNVGLATFNLLIGFSNDLFHAGPSNPDGYIPGMWIFSILGFLGLFFAYKLRQTEKKLITLNE